MSHHAQQPPDRTSYHAAVTAEHKQLADVLAAIRADQDAGLLTARQAADNRVVAYELHADRCRALRQQHLGE